MTCFFISTLFHSTKRIIGIQTINLVLSTVAGILLQGYSGAVQDAVSLIRNLVVLTGRQNRVLSVLFVAASLILGFLFNNRGVIGVLPIVASVQYAVVVLNPKTSEWILKASIFFNTVCWAIYSFYLYNYVNAIANVVIAVTALYQLVVSKKIRASADQGRE